MMFTRSSYHSGYSNSLLVLLLVVVVSTSTAFLVPVPKTTTTTACVSNSFTSSFLSRTQHHEVRSTLFGSGADTTTTSSSDTTNEEGTKTQQQELTLEQMDFIKGYLNKHHSDMILLFAEWFSPLGEEMAKANVWSGGSFSLKSAILTNVSLRNGLQLEVTIEQRNKPQRTEMVSMSMNADPIPAKARKLESVLPVVFDDDQRLPIDDFVRRLSRLTWMVGKPEVSGKLLQLAIQLGGAGIGKLPENMYLNQVPHNRYVRQFFYDTCAEAVRDAVVLCSQGKLTNRMKVISQFPEMNPSMDSYRIGTILELVRAMAIRLAEENVRVRVCVQGSMGVGIFTGVPKQLNGVSKLLQMMDWQSEEGETNAGMINNYVNFGAIGPEHVINEQRALDETTGKETIVQYQDDVFILIAPQSMVGTDSSIIPSLQAMTEAAGDRPVILINPDLTDKISSGGQQSIRGRQARIDFANSFETVYHFQNIYVSGTSYFPILGAITKMHPEREPWVAHQRRDFADNRGEIYVPVLASETMPSGEDIMNAFDM